MNRSMIQGKGFHTMAQHPTRVSEIEYSMHSTVYNASTAIEGHKLIFHLEIVSLRQVTPGNCVCDNL